MRVLFFIRSLERSTFNDGTIYYNQEGDDVYEVEGISFYVSDKSKDYLHNQLFIDFNPALGYKLSSPEEVYKFDLSLKRAGEN